MVSGWILHDGTRMGFAWPEANVGDGSCHGNMRRRKEERNGADLLFVLDYTFSLLGYSSPPLLANEGFRTAFLLVLSQIQDARPGGGQAYGDSKLFHRSLIKLLPISAETATKLCSTTEKGRRRTSRRRLSK